TADIDLAIRPHPPLVTPPSNLANGFVISYPGAVPPGYTVVSRYQGVWLLCRGTVCGQKDRSHE
ncbi:dolichyl-phosphate-mannose--protein mannosyltransferase, partial [Acidithiobacillus ferrooxidans]|nr:dolichyl-phosphate-mannose--protein mannosyltransferase [Acidithiobacillus ferrooxidans]